MDMVALKKEDLPAIRSFTDKMIRPDYVVVSDEMFDWQFLTPIAGQEELPQACHGIRQDDRIVALTLARYHQIWANNQLSPGIWLHEWFADSSCAGSGMLLLRNLLKDKFHGAAGQSLVAINVFSRLAKVCRFELNRLFAILDPEATKDLLIQSSPDAAGSIFLRSVPAPSDEVLLQEAPFDNRYEQEWRDFRQSVSTATDRSAGFMLWRYAKHPLFTYHWRRTSSPAGPAWFVWREEPVDGHEKGVARLCEAIGSPDALRCGFPTLFSFLQNRNLAFVDFFCSHAEVTLGLLSAGMQHVIVQPGFDLPRLFSPLADDIRKRINVAYTIAQPHSQTSLYAHHKAYITKGDVNQDRPNTVLRGK